MPRVLVVDDDAAVGSLLAKSLPKHGFEVEWRTRGSEALTLLSAGDFDVLLTDLKMAEMSGLEVCRGAADRRPDVPVVVMTAFGNLDAAIGAMRAGAYDFVTKPIEGAVLALSLQRAADHRALKGELSRLREEHSPNDNTILGESAPILAVQKLIGRVSGTDASVLVTGESGTGKELVARAIHNGSSRESRPFVPVNCAAIPEALFESELFGHARGSFTDAQTARAGLFSRARKGTLFLDEIGDMPLSVQPKLLRALQEKTIRPVGTDQEESVDVRVVAATNANLEDAVKNGRFREDLYYRLDVVRIELPPLRNRGRDVLLLAQSFVEKFARAYQRPVKRLSVPAADCLLRYEWPGNVRELANGIERAVTLATFDELTVDDLPARITKRASQRGLDLPRAPEEIELLDEVQRRYVLASLDAVRGQKTEAARLLGVDRATLYRWLSRFTEPRG